MDKESRYDRLTLDGQRYDLMFVERDFTGERQRLAGGAIK